MLLLLDTHVLIWFLYESNQLSSRASSIFDDPDHSIYVSSVSAIEIAIKQCIGKLDAEDLTSNYEGELNRRNFRELPMTSRHALLAGSLPGRHRDPFDRIIAAQSLLEGLTLVSQDPAFDSFGIQRFW